ncbi:Unconventional myosin-IXa [Durusdinium trenchii]|uniref:Unconventional myosin-IXa n=1 Tax=Durusdinium trenchii TaxID=1381693 RepID=A0ABP0IJ71_9DINO
MSRPQAGSSSSSRSCSFSCIFVYIQCLAIALLGAYPFVVVITRKMDNSDFVPCSDEAACTFIRYFGVADLPATTGWTIEQSHGTIKQQIHWSSWLPHWLPHYVAIRNGGKVQAVPPSISPSTIAPFAYSCIPAVLSAAVTKKEAFPSSGSVTQDFCQGKPARIHNHLAEGCSRWVYLTGVIMWCLLKTLHDWALLSATMHERLTLKIGIASWCFQAIACCAGIVWAAGAVGVFVSKSSEGTCYYMLDAVNVLVIMLPPFLLLLVTHSKLGNLMLSIVHGDYLYAITYDVPFRVVKSTMPGHPSGSLLTVGLHGDRDQPVADPPQLHFGEMLSLSQLLRGHLTQLWVLSLMVIVGPITMGPLFRRLLQLSLELEWSVGLMGLVKLATFTLALSPLGIVPVVVKNKYPYVARLVEQGERPQCYLKLALILFSDASLFCVALCCSTLRIWPVLWGKVLGPLDYLEESWIWSFHGMGIFYLGYTLAFRMQPPFFNMLRIRDFEWGADVADLQEELEMCEKYPQWQLQAHKFLLQSTTYLDERKELRARLVEMDPELSHVECVNKLLVQHGHL